RPVLLVDYIDIFNLWAPDNLEALTRDIHSMRPIAINRGLPSRKDTAINTVRRVIRRGLIGVSVAQMNVLVLVVANHQIIARVRVNIEYRAKVWADHLLEIRYRAPHRNGHVGYVSYCLRRDVGRGHDQQTLAGTFKI